MKKIYLGSDHQGFELKEKLKPILKSLKIPFEDLGTTSKDSVDYPLVAKLVSKEVKKSNSKGILICGTGIGMSMSANKFKGIRAALVSTPSIAKESRTHNNANILVLSKDTKTPEPILKEFFTTKFKPLARYKRREKQIDLLR